MPKYRPSETLIEPGQRRARHAEEGPGLFPPDTLMEMHAVAQRSALPGQLFLSEDWKGKPGLEQVLRMKLESSGGRRSSGARVGNRQ